MKQTFISDGLEIAFDIVGTGPPVFLIHGFASDAHTNWRDPGWYTALEQAGYQVIALDCRGHGASAKPHQPQFYTRAKIAGDIINLMDHLQIGQASVMGYSMGGRIAIELGLNHADRFDKIILGGVGETLFKENPDRRAITDALLTPDGVEITNTVAKVFRAFARRQNADLAALAATSENLWIALTKTELSHLDLPVLVVAGSEDEQTGSPLPLAAALPRAQVSVIEGRNHMNTVGDKRYKDAVIAFLGETRD